MSPRTRVLILFVVTLALVGAGFGYTVGRIEKWHEQGWTGLSYYPSVPQPKKPGAPKTAPQRNAGEVLMTWGGTADAIVQPKDRIVSINGIPIENVDALRALSEKATKGTPLTFRIERAGKTFDTTIRLESPLRSTYIVTRTIVAVLVALIYVAVAFVVFQRRPEDKRVLLFYAFAVVSSLALFGKAATVFETAGGRGIQASFSIGNLTVVLVFLVTILYAPLILHFALIFPRERPIVQRHPVLVRWVYAGALLGALLVLALGVVSLMFFRDIANVERAAHQVGFVVAKVTNYSVIIGLLLALQAIWAGRREGVVRAFTHRPLRATLAIFAFFLGATVMIGRYGSGLIALIVALLLVFIPILLIASYPILAAVALMRSYRESGVEEKRQVQWPVWGLCTVVAVKGIAFATSFAISIGVQAQHSSMLPWRGVFYALDIVPTLLSLLVPFSFAFAILKYRLMNIDVIIRKTVVYAMLSGAIVIVYLAVVGILGTLLVEVAGVRNQTMIIGATLIVALVIVPMRNKLQAAVERTMFRQKYDYPQALRAISTEAIGASDLGTFLNSAAETIQRALQNRAIAIFVTRHDDLVAAAKVGLADSILGTLRIPRQAMHGLLDRPFDPRRHALPDDAAPALKRIEATLVVPINTPGTPPNGFIALAPKLSGGEFDVEDIDFLHSVASQLDVGIDRIRMQVEEADFAQARAIQQTLLPREMPHVAKLELAGMWKPARTMGGDYYDLLELSEHQLAVCIGDVAGKGMPAALLMSGLQAAVRASASDSPRDLCERVRRVVVSSLSGGRFVTFFYATLDTEAMRLRWCNAGHNAPILARADGSVVRLADGGPAISRLFRDTPYTEHEIDLRPGDRLVCFTDGVSEVSDGDGELLGEQRLEELVADARELGAQELQRTIVDAALAHGGGELEDDLTLVVVGLAS